MYCFHETHETHAMTRLVQLTVYCKLIPVLPCPSCAQQSTISANCPAKSDYLLQCCNNLQYLIWLCRHKPPALCIKPLYTLRDSMTSVIIILWHWRHISAYCWRHKVYFCHSQRTGDIYCYTYGWLERGVGWSPASPSWAQPRGCGSRECRLT